MYNRTKRTEWCLFQVTSRPCPVAPAVGGQEGSWGCTVTPRRTVLPRGLLSHIVRWHRPSYHSMATGMLSNSLCQFQVRVFYSSWILVLNGIKKLVPNYKMFFKTFCIAAVFIHIFLTHLVSWISLLSPLNELGGKYPIKRIENISIQKNCCSYQTWQAQKKIIILLIKQLISKVLIHNHSISQN